MQNKCVSKQRYALFCLFTFLLFYSYTAFGACINLHRPNFFENSFSILYQQHQVRGTVTDSQGVPIPSVHVLIQNSGVGTYTDNDGSFSLNSSPTDVLVFTYLGFDTLSVPVDGQSELSIELQESVTNLGEVVLNAGYYKVSDQERTGSIATISASDIEDQPVTNVLATMQGRMPGVLITQDTGVPGSGFQIQIRGQNSLRTDGNNPLYIIDGVPYSSQSVGSGDTGAGGVFNLASPLNSIDPGLISSIEVLKDADATAIYGSRGANGVVLITTKKGKSGKTRFQLGYSYGTGRVHSFLELMDTSQYLQMRKEAYANDGITTYPANAYDINGTWEQNRYTDWQDVFIGGTSEYTDVNGSISGGNEFTQFNISGNYHKETTVYPGDYAYNKLGLHALINHKTKDEKFNVQLTTTYTLQDNKLPGESLISDIYQLPPNAPALYNEDGSLNWENGTWNNPLSILERTYNSNSYDLVSGAFLAYKVLPALELKVNLGYTDTQFYDKRLKPSTEYNPAFEITSEIGSIASKNYVHRKSWIVEPQLSYEKQFGKLKTNLLVGGTFQKQTSDQLVLLGIGFVSNSLIDNMAAAIYQETVQDDQSQYKYNAIFGRWNLNFLNRYIVNFTGRRDGSSRFGPGKQFANFGAIGAAWLFSNEKLFENSSFISFGKLRASYGITGNDQIGDYQYLDTYTVSSNSYNGISGMEPSGLFNPNFSWEENKKLEAALEMGFFNDRIFFTSAYYKNSSSNQLVGIPLPATTGFSSIQANLNATVENKGWEFSLRTENFKNSQFYWSTAFNISLNRNKLISFPGLEGSTYANSYVIGEPLNIQKVFQYEGLDAQTGMYQFTDFNQDGVLSRQDDREAIKNLNPKFFGGLQNSIRYKGFTLDFLFQFVKQQNYSGTYLKGMPGRMENQPTVVEDRWQQPGDITTYQPYSTGANSELRSRYNNYGQSDAVIQDASFIRLKNLSIAYKLSDKIFKVAELTFLLRGQNLFTITDFDGFDPESKYSNSLPPLQVLTTGVQLNF